MIIIGRCGMSGLNNQNFLHWGGFYIGVAHTKCKRVPIRLRDKLVRNYSKF